jgi:hypothetical protein
MATSRNITYTFANQLSVDLWTDGTFYEWNGDTSGKFESNASPVRIPAFSTKRAFAACGDSDSTTGVTGMVKYWAVPAGASGNSNAVGHVSFAFSIAYDHGFPDYYSNKWSNDGSGALGSTGKYKFSTSGWNSSADSVAITVTFAAASAATP